MKRDDRVYGGGGPSGVTQDPMNPWGRTRGWAGVRGLRSGFVRSNSETSDQTQGVT